MILKTKFWGFPAHVRLEQNRGPLKSEQVNFSVNIFQVHLLITILQINILFYSQPSSAVMMIQNILLHVNDWLHNQSRIIQRAFYPKEPENGHTEVEKSD